jgi:hypothetical protein
MPIEVINGAAFVNSQRVEPAALDPSETTTFRSRPMCESPGLGGLRAVQELAS